MNGLQQAAFLTYLLIGLCSHFEEGESKWVPPIERCPGVEGCSCILTEPNRSRSFNEGGFKATCTGANPNFTALYLKNVTFLNLNNCQFSNESILWNLRRADLSEEFKFRNTPVSAFNWNWLPDTAVSVFLAYFQQSLRLVAQSEKEAAPRDNDSALCAFRKASNITKVYLYSIPYKNVPECLPPTTTSLSLVDCSLTDFEVADNASLVRNATKWPPALRVAYIKRAQMASIGPHAFQGVPPTMDKLIVGTCQKQLGRMPSYWPPTLQYLWLMNCGVTEVTSQDLRGLSRIENINLGGNKLVTLPELFPVSMRKLAVGYNAIAHVRNVRWDTLTNLTAIDLSHNKLTSVPLDLPSCLKILELRNNEIDYCARNAFAHTKQLETLDLSFNNLFNMPENLPTTIRHLSLRSNSIGLVRTPASYEFCVNCVYVDLSGNPWVCDGKTINMILWLGRQNIRHLKLHGQCATLASSLSNDELEEFLMYLQYLRLEVGDCFYDVRTMRCNSTDIQTFPKDPPRGLETLIITGHPSLTTMPPNLYKSQKNLELVNLESNNLTHFPRGLPSSVRVLQLSHNRIAALTDEDQETLDSLVNLRTLVLSYNLIETVYDYQIAPLVSLKYFRIFNNPLRCDCSLQSLSVWYSKRHVTTHERLFLTPHCYSPPDRKGQLIVQLTGAFDYQYKCAPSTCDWEVGKGILNCSRSYQESILDLYNETFTAGVMPVIPANSYWISLDLCELQLTSDQVTTKHLLRLETLNLTGNLITDVPVRNLSASLKRLILIGNRVEHLPRYDVVSAYLPALELLDLRRNLIASIDQGEVKLFPLVNNILLHGNPLLCDCKMRPLVTWIQTTKDNQQGTAMHYFENLTCFAPPKLSGRYLGELSEEQYCSATLNVALIAGLIAGIIVVVVAAVISNFILHKRRKRQERRDVVQGFKDLLEREAILAQHDPETGICEQKFEYDAFVSYCCGGSDEDFVFDMLEELEENQGRSLCLHERDFVPGRGIADNIVQCIVASRKVILVISRKYASSSWCQYEVQVALAQLHERRRGRLLVPVLLEDVTRDEAYAGSVKTILSAITGIHAPAIGDSARAWKEFWHKLDAALKQ